VRESTDAVISELDRTQTLSSSENGSGSSVLSTLSPLTFLDVVELMWNQRRFVGRCVLATAFVFAIVAFLLPKHYIAVTQLMPPDYGSNSAMALALPALSDQGGNGGGGGGTGLMGLASQLLGMNTSGDLFVGVMQSETVEDRVIQEAGLMKVYSDKYLEDARKDLESNTTVKSDSKTGIISLSFDDKNPERAAVVAKAYVRDLNDVLAEVNTSSAHRERLFLEQRLQEIKLQADVDEKEFSLFASQNAAIDIPSQAKAMVEAGAELQSELIVAQSELKGLEQIFTDGNFQVKAAKARMEELERQVNKFGGKNVDPSKDTSLAQGELYPSVRQLPLLGVKYLDLYRRTKIDEAVFELLTKEYEVAKIQEARSVPTAQVLDAALVPEKKSSPHRFLIILGGALLGFALSGTYLLGFLLWDRTDDNDRTKIFIRTLVMTWRAWIGRVPIFKKNMA
jgi:uncharacterized protein involved in exopolysaccharide biosynthesis